MPQRPFYSILLWNFFFRWLPGLVLVFGSMPTVYGQALTLTPSNQAGTCGTPNGVLILTISGGQSPYQVTVTGGPTTVTPFSLSLPANATSVTKNLTGMAPGFYNITVTDNNGAGTTVTQTQEVGNIPGPTNVFFAEETPASCLNDDGVASATIVGGTVPYTFSYNGAPVGTTSNLTGEATGLPSGDLLLTVSDGNGCTATAFVTIDINNNLSLLTNSPTICEGTSQTLSILTNATAFTWTPATGLSSTTIANPVASPSTTTYYTVAAKLGVCARQAGLTVTVLPAPVASAVSPDTTCYGKSILIKGSGGVSYLWTPATYLNSPKLANPLVVAPTSSIVYNLTVTDANGCKSLTPAVVDLYVRPPYVVSAGPDTSVTVGQAVDLNALDVQGVGFNQYVWTPGTFLNNPFIADPVASFSETGIYTYAVVATAPDGCAATDSVTIKVYAVSDIFVPSGFTPNGDGHNDVLRAIPVSMRSFKYLTVFNRWGQQVFTTTNAGIGWDGTYNGSPAPAGTYVWIVGGVDYTGRVVEKRGTVILIR